MKQLLQAEKRGSVCGTQYKIQVLLRHPHPFAFSSPPHHHSLSTESATFSRQGGSTSSTTNQVNHTSTPPSKMGHHHSKEQPPYCDGTLLSVGDNNCQKRSLPTGENDNDLGTLPTLVDTSLLLPASEEMKSRKPSTNKSPQTPWSCCPPRSSYTPSQSLSCSS